MHPEKTRIRKGTSNYKTVDCILETAVLFKVHHIHGENTSESSSAGTWHPGSGLHVPWHHERANYCLRYGVLLLCISLSCPGLHLIPGHPGLLCSKDLPRLLDFTTSWLLFLAFFLWIILLLLMQLLSFSVYFVLKLTVHEGTIGSVYHC